MTPIPTLRRDIPRPADPFALILDSSAEYAGTVLELRAAACEECGCTPDAPWGCGCGNPDCPCSEEEDEECE